MSHFAANWKHYAVTCIVAGCAVQTAVGWPPQDVWNVVLALAGVMGIYSTGHRAEVTTPSS